jgi:ribonuclease HI
MSVHTIQQEAIDQNVYTLTTSPIPNNAIPCFVSATGDIHTSFQRQITIPQYRIPQSHHNHLLIVSNASVINGNATWAFTIATPDGHQLISQLVKVRGQNITSFQAKLLGVLSALIETREFAPDAKYTVYCDNKSVITRLTSMQSLRPQVSWSDYDLLYTCYVNFHRHVFFEHVKGHQDRVNSWEELSIKARLNILMDLKAAQAHTDPNTPQELKHTSTISLNGKVLTGKLTTSLQNEVNTNRITQYYQRKFGEQHDKVLWDVFYGTILHYKQLPKGVHNMIHNIAPTQQVQCQQKHLTDGSCFFCNTSIETIQHVVTCPSHLMDCKSLFL